MGVFEQFPYTNFHGVNLDWILNTIRDHETRIVALESWKVVTDGRLDSLEDRMDTAENDIDALKGRMDTAESDIDALEGRMDTAETDIADLEPRVTALETQTPKSTADQSGFVLASDSAGVGSWKINRKIYSISRTDLTLVNPAEWCDAFNAGASVYVELVGAGSMPTARSLVTACRSSSRYKVLYFRDQNTMFQQAFSFSTTVADDHLEIKYDNNSGTTVIETSAV